MNRIQFIASLTKGYDTVLDIGSDHGLVLKHALDQKYIKYGLASDIHKGPLNHAKQNLAGYPVRFYLSDGFKNVDADFDLAVITGMGAELIIDILTYAQNQENKTYILGTHNNIWLLRKWLSDNHYKIVDEFVVFDKFYYIFLKVIKGQMNLSLSDMYVGPILKLKSTSKAYYNHQVKHYKNLLSKAKGQRLDTIIEILSYFQNCV